MLFGMIFFAFYYIGSARNVKCNLPHPVPFAPKNPLAIAAKTAMPFGGEDLPSPAQSLRPHAGQTSMNTLLSNKPRRPNGKNKGGRKSPAEYQSRKKAKNRSRKYAADHSKAGARGCFFAVCTGRAGRTLPGSGASAGEIFTKL